MNRICTKYFKAGFSLAGLLLLCTVAAAQYPVSGEILDVNNDYRDVRVVLEDGNSLQVIPVSAKGSFYTTLDWNTIYSFSFKKKGYVTKVIEFSTYLPNDVTAASIEPYHMPVRLFKVFEGVDTVFFKNPVAKIRFDAKERRADGSFGDFADDRDYSLKVKYHIDQMRQEGSTDKTVKASEPVDERKRESVKSNRTTKTEEKKLAISEPEWQEVDDATQQALVRRELTGAPPLKEVYAEGETIEEFELKNRDIVRTIFVYDGQRRVFLSVKHDWGGHFYFIDEAHIGYRCISKEVYENSIVRCRTKLIVNK